MPAVLISQHANREFKKLDKYTRQVLLKKIALLYKTPFTPQTKSLSGIPNGFRLRIGDYRVLYRFNAKQNTIEIFRIAHRKEVYKK